MSIFKSKSIYLYLFLSLLIVLLWTLAFLIFPYKNFSPKADLKRSEESSNFIVSKMGECAKAKKRTECLKQTAKDFLNNFTLKEVLSVFEKNETKPELISICHEAAHYLGRKEYQKQQSLSKVFSSCNHSCLGGCYHGALEGYFINQNITINGEDDSEVASKMPGLCGVQSNYQIPQDFTECLHGLGHAVMFLSENDLLRSLKLCDQLHTKDEQDLCYTGAFMANVDGAQSGSDHPSKYFKPDNDLYPCTILGEKYLSMCYTYAVLQPHQGDLKKTIDICLMVPPDYRNSCFRTMGRDRVYNTTDESVMKKECDLISEHEFRNECYIGVVGSIVVRYGIDSQSPFRYCSILDIQFKDSCYREIALRLKNWTQDENKLLNICSKLPKEYINTCQLAVR